MAMVVLVAASSSVRGGPVVVMVPVVPVLWRFNIPDVLLGELGENEPVDGSQAV